MDNREPDPDLRGYIAMLRRRGGTVLVTIATVVIVAMLVILIQGTIYEASVKVAVEPPSQRTELERILFGITELGTQREILTSTALVRDVLDAHGLPAEESNIEDFLEDDIDVETLRDTTVLQVSVRASEPRLAASLAQSMAESYLRYLQRDAEQRTIEAFADLDTAQETTQQELRSIERQLAQGAGSTRESLEERRDELYARLRFISTRRAELETTNAFMRRGDIIQPAIVPDDPVSPKPIRTGILALVLGTLLGMGLALLRDRLDDRVRDLSSLHRADAGPMLVALPSSDSDLEPIVRTAPNSAAADAYRRLRTTLVSSPRFLGMQGLRLLVVPVGADAVAGAVAANLSLILVDAGRKVALIDADLEHGYASRLLETTGPGLAEMLCGRAAKDLMHEPFPNLRVLSAGEASAQGRGKMGSSHFRAFLEDVSEQVDDVVVVAPPVDACADALELAAQGCAVTLVAQQAVTTESQLRDAMEQFTQIGAVYLGAVVVDTTTSQRAGRAMLGRRWLTVDPQPTHEDEQAPSLR